MMVGYVYQYTNKNNGLIYIGSTTLSPARRASLGYRNSPKFYQAILEHGFDNFNIEILWEVESDSKEHLKKDLLILERTETNSRLSNVDGIGYNINDGAHRVVSDETRRKISLAMAGRVITWADKIGKSNRGQIRLNMRGRELSAVTRKKISDAKMGHVGYWTNKNRPTTNVTIVSLEKARHTRWHAKRGVTSNTCALCI